MIRKITYALACMLLVTSLATAQKSNKPSKTGTNVPATNATTTTTTTATTSISTRGDAEKEAVKTFGLSIIESYFRKDCDFVWTRLGDPMKSLESQQSFPKTPELKKSLCDENPLRTDIKVTYSLYQQNYNAEVLTAAEFAQKNPKIQEVLKLQAGDFYFDGTLPKDAGSTRLFRASDMARFIVRKQANGTFLIIMM